MYRREEASQIRHEFWTVFGRYMAPVPSADGDEINWINYKSGFKHVQFKLETGRKSAIAGIYLTHNDLEIQELFYQHFLDQKNILEDITGYKWNWQLHVPEDTEKIISRIYQEKKGLSVFNREHWPELISFFKSRIIVLDQFWSLAKYSFDELR
ncbi:MAG: DUF4268 domain-containing protein [Candidatus Cyclobacteriaceae bacterium M2_1C_046]